MLGERLIQLRNKRNLTQQFVADKIHLSRSTYAQYEINRRVPEYLTLEKLADFFEVSIDYLVGREATDGKKEETELDKDKKYLLDLIVGIEDPVKRKAAITVLEGLAGKK